MTTVTIPSTTVASEAPPIQTTTKAPFVATVTAKPSTTTKLPPPLPEPGCALAYDQQYTIGDPEEGYRFGKFNYCPKRHTLELLFINHKINCFIVNNIFN